MQAVAAEMNLSETAFVVPKEEDGQYDLRWFTPVREVTLCGHATLAAAHALLESGFEQGNIVFDTKSGLLAVMPDSGYLHMDFPVSLPEKCATLPQELYESLGITLKRDVYQVWFGQEYDYLVPVDGNVRDIEPSFEIMAILNCRGVIVTAAGEGKHDFQCRFFAPGVGIPEDPVTGSAFCGLAPYWAERLEKTEMVGYQASHRGGLVRCALKDDNRVILSGQAVTFFSTDIAPPG